MRDNIDLAQSREFGEIISDTFRLIKQNLKPLLKAYFVICGLFLVADIAVSMLANTNADNSPTHSLMGFAELVFDFINHITLMVTVLSYLSLYKEKGNQPPAVVEVWGYFRYFFFRVFFTEFLLSIAVLIGFFICLLPGIYLAFVFALVVPVMVMENGNIEYSFKKAFKIIKGNWWFTFGVLLLIVIIMAMCMLILMTPPMIIYGSAQWLSGKSMDSTGTVLQAVILNLCQVLWIVPVVGTALVYYTLTEEKEGNSLISRINMFGKNDPGADQISSEQY